MKGVSEFNVEGEVVGFRFDMIAAGRLEEIEKRPISLIMDELAQCQADSKKLRIGLVMNILYSSACSYAEWKDKPEPKRSKVSEWVQEIDATDLYTMIGSGLSMFSPKNSKAPEMEGAIQ